MITIISSALKAMAVYIFGATGDSIMEKGGHLNMGVPGTMFFGALGGYLFEALYTNGVPEGVALNPFLILFMPVLGAILFGAIFGFIYCFLTVTLKSNQNVVGLSLTTLGVGLSKFMMAEFAAKTGAPRFVEAAFQLSHLFPNYQQAGNFGEMFLSGSIFTYSAIVIAIVTSIIISRTKIGLNLKAVGENPASADAAGINVTKYRYLSTIIGAMIVSLGGITYGFDVAKGSFAATNPIDSWGWLCLSIVILSAWRSWISIPISFMIGFLSSLSVPLQLPPAFSALIDVTPYALTIIVLIITSAIGSKKMKPPAGLGQTYFREDR